MGPLATADLYRKIVTMTKADSDNGHIRVYIDSNCAIPDRTAAIIHGGADPVPEMASALRNLEKCGADCIIIPCNTAHWFLPPLRELTDTPILDMTEITARRCAALYGRKTAALLATTGTLSTGLYNAALERAGVPALIPDENEQQQLMYMIYDVVKASRPVSECAELWAQLLQNLRSRGAEYFILACTELPILAQESRAAGPFVDPTAELARAAITFCGYEAVE